MQWSDAPIVGFVSLLALAAWFDARQRRVPNALALVVLGAALVGVLAGAAIGSNTGRGDSDQQVVTTPNVQRCSRNPSQARAAYWDVAYNFRGQEYRVQMTQEPGRTVTVNEQGEPRG